MALSRTKLSFNKSTFFEGSLNRSVLPDIIIGDSADEKTYIGIQKLNRFNDMPSKPKKNIYYFCHRPSTLTKVKKAYEENPFSPWISKNNNVMFCQIENLPPTDLTSCDFIFLDEIDDIPLETITILWNLAKNNNIIYSEPTDSEKRKFIYNLVLPAKLKNAQSTPKEKLPSLHFMAEYYQAPEQRSDLEKAIALAGDNINAVIIDNVSALYIACTFGNTQAVELLLKHPKINVNIKLAIKFETPLLVATEKGHEKIVEMLLQHGADINAKLNDDVTTAFSFALHYGHINILKMLYAHNAKLEDPSDSTDPFLLMLPHCFLKPNTLSKECATSPVFLNDLAQQLKKHNIILSTNNLSNITNEELMALILYLIFAIALKPKAIFTITINEQLFEKIYTKLSIPLIQTAILNYFDPTKQTKGLQPLALLVNKFFTESEEPENTLVCKR